MISSPGSAMASRALKKAMLPPAVTTIRLWPASLIPLSAASLFSSVAINSGIPSTDWYLWLLGLARKCAMRSAACGGGAVVEPRPVRAKSCRGAGG